MCRFISEGVPRDPGRRTYLLGAKFKMADFAEIKNWGKINFIKYDHAVPFWKEI